MSHTSTVNNVVIVDQDALRRAVDQLKSSGINCELVENEQPRAYYANQAGMETAPLVLKLPDAEYDIGFYPREDGRGLEARTDFYRGSVERILGVTKGENDSQEQAKLGKLYNAYAENAISMQAARQGKTVNRVTREDGSVQLRIAV